jgi:hypothetical protein
MQLVNALQRLKNVMLLQNLSHQHPDGLDYTDTELLYRLINEVEHELLSYPYRWQADRDASLGQPNLRPTEVLARVASICFLNSVIIVTPSATGMGRALTKHLKQVISNFIDLNPLWQLPLSDLDLLAWSLFIAAHGSLGQVERPWFVSRMADVISALRWKVWEEVVEVMHRYFYIPYIHGMVWRPIWDEAIAHLALTEADTE